MSDEKDPDFLSVAQAADYIDVSAATLRRWDDAGKLVATKRPGSDYRYYKRSDLEQFRLEYGHAEASINSVSGFYSEATPSIQRNPYLREPQREAFDAAVTHFKESSEPAIIQLPVGCGKTGLAAILPFGLSNGRVLVVAPNKTIRSGLYADLNISNAGCFWKKANILTDFSKGPFVALVDGPKANIDDCAKSHIVVANIQQLASKADRWLSQFPPDFFDLVIIDEGHHVAAESWQRVIRAFPKARFVSMTATPFRSDNQDLVGTLIYHYSFSRAMINGYIKHVSSTSARPAEISFSVKDESRTFTLEEVLAFNELAWFRHGVALSEECNRHIAEKSVEKMQEMRSHTGFPHQIIASAMTMDHARQVRAIYEEMGLQAAEIYSEMPDDRKDTVFAKLRSGQLDCVVQVSMLGEGFDHPPLSIAAIFKPYRSLAPYIQFVGRIMRTVEPNDADHPNNQGFIVSHAGLNNEERWDDFRDLDAQDQELVKSWANGIGNSGSGSAVKPRDDEQEAHRYDDQPVADNEILSHFLSQAYLDPDDDTVIDQILDTKAPGGFTLRELGITPEKLRELYATRNTRNEAPAVSQTVQPQVRRQTLRKRLDERSKSVHNRILADLNLSRAGYDIARAVPGARGNNGDALFSALNNQINELVGQETGTREDWTVEQIELAYKSLDQVGDGVSKRIKDAIEGGNVPN